MHFTLWPSLVSSTGKHIEVAWDDLLTFVSTPTIAAEKTKLEGWSPARFTDNRRARTACELVSAVVLDLDSGKLSTDEIAETFAAFEGFIHTSFSHMPEHPKHRVILRTSRDMTPQEHAAAWLRVAVLGEVDGATRDPSRLWFVPAHAEGAPYEWRKLAGKPIDVDSLPVLAKEPAPRFANVSISPPNSGQSRRTSMAAALGAAWPGKGQRHEAQLALAGALRNEGWTADEALEFLCDVCRAAGDENRSKREATIRHTWERVEGSALTGWTRLKSFVDPVIVDAARGALGRDAAWTEATTRRLAELAAKPALSAPPGNPMGILWGGWDELPIVPPYLLHGLIPAEKVCTFFAEGGSVKSWAAFDLAISVATGRPWLGAITVNQGKPGRALILDYEDGREEFKRRKQILVRADNDPLPLLGYKYANTDILNPQTWLDLANLGLTLLVVDSLGAAMPGDADENATTFAAAIKLAGPFTTYTKVTVVFVAHANKTGGLRGTGAIRDQSDCAFTFVSVSEGEDGEKRVRLVCDKPGPQKKPAPVNILLTDRGLATFTDDAPPAVEISPESRIREAILSHLKGKPAGVPKDTLLEAIAGKNETKREILGQLILSDIVVEHRLGTAKILTSNLNNDAVHTRPSGGGFPL